MSDRPSKNGFPEQTGLGNDYVHVNSYKALLTKLEEKEREAVALEDALKKANLCCCDNEEKNRELKAENERLMELLGRLSVLSIKHCPREHRDFEEITNLIDKQDK